VSDSIESVFFFQAEDGIRDFHVTGVQTCALPICITIAPQAMGKSILSVLAAIDNWLRGKRVVLFTLENSVEMTWDRVLVGMINRSEERRVGKECRSRRWRHHRKKKYNVVKDVPRQ